MISRNAFEAAANHFVARIGDSQLRRSEQGECFIVFSYSVKGCVRCDGTIAYSQVYSVPQIFFRMVSVDANQQSERVMDLDEVIATVPHMNTRGQGAFEPAVGVGTDPLDGLASFFVHPCRTGDIMSEMPQLSPEEYLISYWNLFKVVAR